MILISGKRVNCNYKIQGGDELTHTVHRHEPAVGLSEYTTTNPCNQPPVDIIYEDDSLLVVDKPSTMPIHPCGAYHYNSLFEILSHWKPHQYGPGKLYTIYRLDRLTSGVVLLAKNASLAKTLGKCIAERDGCAKIYLARVKGKFPLNVPVQDKIDSWKFYQDESDASSAISSPCIHGECSQASRKHWKGGVQVPLNKCDNNSCAGLGYWFTDQKGRVNTAISVQDVFQQATTMPKSYILDVSTNIHISDSTYQTNDTPLCWLNFACPCRVSSHKDGICEAGDFAHLADEKERKTIKPAQTSFTILTYDDSSDTSVVLAKPITGRTHQIRLHLQQLGHPIANDHCYGGELWCDDSISQEACDKARQWLNQLDDTASMQSTLSDVPATDAEIYHLVANTQRLDGESTLTFIEKTCVWCARCMGAVSGDAKSNINDQTRKKRHDAVSNRTIVEYFVRSQGIWLHALQYSLIKCDFNEMNKTLSYQTKLPRWALLSS
jgi:23S rRNA-/tRNA-specific pseudouridylate synthase